MNTITETGLQNCAKGDFVAYDPTIGAFVKAAAAWRISGDDNSLCPAYSAYVVGVLTSDPDTSGSGIVTTDGGLTSADVNIVNSGPGDYYLKNNGQAVNGVPEGMLPVYCGTLTASGNFILRPVAPEYRGHRHTNHKLTGEWTSAGGWYIYDELGVDGTAANILASVPKVALSVVENGALLDEDGYDVVNGSLRLASNPANKDVVICTINPLIATDSEVRAIAPANGNNILKVSKAYGTVYLDTDFIQTVSEEHGGVCITGIDRAGITTDSVINTIIGNGGVNVEINNGTATITGDITYTRIDFQTVNANNVLIGNSNSDAYITFPAGIQSSVIGTARLPYKQSGTWTVTLFLWIVGGNASSLSATVTGYQPSNTVITPTTQATLAFGTASGSDISTVYEVVSTTTYTGYPDGIVTAVINAASPANAVKIKALGIKIA